MFSSRTCRLLLPVLLLQPWVCCAGRYRPVVIVHGLLDGPKQFMELVDFIKQAHPGTEVTVIDLFSHLSSLQTMWKQVRGFSSAVHAIQQKSADGVHLLCFSQGGLICRGLLSTTPNHNVHTFISLSSPQAGQYGDTEFFNKLFPDVVKEEVFQLCYRTFGQRLSICDYWNDPHHRNCYLKNNEFLPLLNGERPHEHIEEWRENFLQIRKLVLIGGPDDGVITPWESSLFGFFNSNETVVEMRKQEFYRNDTFGLRTLDARGDLSQCVQAGVKHFDWHANVSVFSLCMEPWLT